MEKDMRELNLKEMESVAGGSSDQIIELRKAVMGNRVLKKIYDEFNAEDDEQTDDVLLERVLAEGCSVRIKIQGTDLFFNDGKWSYEEALDHVRRAYGGSRRRK